MPIVAESGPLPFGGSNGSTTTTLTPYPSTPTVKPTTNVTTQPTSNGDIVRKHQQFISAIDQQNCFNRQDLPQFTDDEFSVHIEIAKIDKYIVEDDNRYCNMQGLKDMVKALKRYYD